MKKSKNQYEKKVKHLEVMLYLEDGWNEANILDELHKRSSVKEYALMLHDSDVSQKTGELVKPHYHCYLNFGKTTWTFAEVAKWFNISPELVNKIESNKWHTLNYYTHNGKPEKYQYPVENFISNFDVPTFLANNAVKQNNSELTEQLIRACSTGAITRLDYMEHMDGVIYTKCNDDLEVAWKYWQDCQLGKKVNRAIVYVWGEPGCGKTLGSQLFAEALGYHVYVTSPGANKFDEYRQEEAIVIDDIRPNAPFNLTDLLALTDGNTAKVCQARYKNKFLAAKIIFLTTVLSPQDFWDGFGASPKEPSKQLFRRFSEVWRVTETEIQVSEFIDDKFVLKNVYPNPVPAYVAAHQAEAVKLDSGSIFAKLNAENAPKEEVA